MDTLQAEGISTFLISSDEYADLTRRARLADFLADKINSQGEEITGLKNEIKTLQDNQGILFDLFNQIRANADLQPKQKDRREILLALLAANGGKMFAKEARQKMGLKKATFSVLLRELKDEIDKKPYHLNKRQLVISLR